MGRHSGGKERRLPELQQRSRCPAGANLGANVAPEFPPLFGLEVLTAFARSSGSPGEAAAFDPALSRRAPEWAAREAAFVGVNWTFAPMADLSRDSRWGRIVEGSARTRYLGSVLTAARVEGFREGGLATATKHFAGYGAPQGGATTTRLYPARRSVRHLPAALRAALKAGSVSFMAALNALNGVPSTANPWLLTMCCGSNGALTAS